MFKLMSPEPVQGITLNVKVFPGSKEFAFEFDEAENLLKVRLKEKAIKGKANQALLKALKKALKAPVAIVAGPLSRDKRVFVENHTKENALKLLLRKFAP